MGNLTYTELLRLVNFQVFTVLVQKDANTVELSVCFKGYSLIF